MTTQAKQEEELVWKTYKQWEAEGRQVKKGRKAAWFDGVPMFNEKQTKIAREDDSDYHPGAAYASCPQDWD